MIGKIDTMKDGDIYTIQLNFTESLPKSRIMSKGTIYISGEMTSDRPNFKLVFEKSDEITDTDIKAFVECYKYC